MNHLNAREIRRLRLGLGGGEPKESLLHLLTCSHCRRRAAVQTFLAEDWALGEVTPAEAFSGLGSPLLERSIATFNGNLAAAHWDRERAEVLFRELRDLSPERQTALAASDPRYASAGLGLRLLEAAEGAASEEPYRAEQLAELALAISRRLDPSSSGFVVAGLAGGAWCWIAESRRVRGDLPSADAAYEEARWHLEQLPPFAAERADFCQLSARLRRDQSRDDEAFSLLSRALEIFESYPDREQAGECALDLGWMYLEELETAEALPLFEQAAARFREVEAFGAWLSARHGLALCYADLQWHDQVAALLDGLREVSAALSPLDRLRAAAVEADVAQAMDDNERAARWLETIWTGLYREGAVFEALRAGLDLARLYLEQERLEDLERLREPLLSLPELPALPREVLSFSFAFARQHGLAGVEILELAKSYLLRARHDPSFPFTILRRPAREVRWDEADAEFRANAVAYAGLSDGVAHLGPKEIDPVDRRRLSWMAAAAMGMNLVFSSEDAPGAKPAAEPGPESDREPFVH